MESDKDSELPTMPVSQDTAGDGGNTDTAVVSEEDVQKHFRKPGMAWMKSEYILMKGERERNITGGKTGSEDKSSTGGPPTKKQKTSGRNWNRPVERRPPASEKICPSIIQERECNYGDSCKFCHDKEKFMNMKPPDIGEVCYVFEKYGRCPQSIACRYGAKHIDSTLSNIVNKPLYEKMSQCPNTVNFLDRETQRLLWKRKYDFSKANENSKKVQTWYNQRKAAIEKGVSLDEKRDMNHCGDQTSKHQSSGDHKDSQNSADSEVTSPVAVDISSCTESEKAASDAVDKSDSAQGRNVEGCSNESGTSGVRHSGCLTDEDVIKLRPAEIKKVDFNGKLYLAPLTTVGNLPFRRICKRFGADVTCSEMAVATNLLQANQSEWALIKRHKSEDIFGVQVCGAYSDTLTRCAQLLNEVASIDFVDFNCGCPIDMVFKRGEGSALIAKPNKLEQIVKSMTSVLNVPLTLKMRTGIMSEKPVAHTLIPKLRNWGISQVTLHGRSREQRYTRLADWDYINQCAQLAAPMPVFGNGDILSYEEYYDHLDNTSVGGIMIARGALIKPWIFTEIKERRHWDISASERLDILKDFVNFGLEHWGSDQQGVENVRRFLLEQLSFSYRYIPVGLLEQLPQKVNDRPPSYRGRSDLETLLSSSNCSDWIKISEMLLGPVPKVFTFLPKHKANSFK